MIPFLTLGRGGQDYLIIRTAAEFHIIDVNEALTKDKRAAVLEKGCTPAEMQAMGLSGMTIPRSEIQALTVTGCGYQDDVIFYLNKKKLAFWLPEACEQRRVDDFFRGIPRRQYKTRTRIKGGRKIDWRTREQKPEFYYKLRPVGWGWNIVCVLSVIWLLTQSADVAVWGWVVSILCLAAVFLDMLLPEYFTLLLPPKRRYRSAQIRAINLSYGLMGMLYSFFLICSRRYHFFEEFRLFPAALVMTLVVGVILFVFCREFREETGIALLSLVMVLLFSFGCFIPHLNHILGPDLTPCTVSIVDLHKITGGKGPNYYYCTVQFPDGRELDVSVSREEYEAYRIGGDLDLQVGTGFFDVEYAIDG